MHHLAFMQYVHVAFRSMVSTDKGALNGECVNFICSEFIIA